MKTCENEHCQRLARRRWCSDACRQAAYRNRHVEQAPRHVYVYRLNVEYPEGVDWQNPPKEWTPLVVDTELGPETQNFSWPTRRHYMSREGATNRATLLRGWGCTVTVERSEPVTWA